MAKPIDIKKGDTFLVVCTFTDSAGAPVDITNVEIISNVRSLSGVLISNLTVTKEPQSGTTLGKYTLRSETGTWNVGQYNWDIQYTNNNFVQSTDTLTINVIQDVSRV